MMVAVCRRMYAFHESDPDSRPPCRLLDVVRHGDYGFKFRYGRDGLHPFEKLSGVPYDPNHIKLYLCGSDAMIKQVTDYAQDGVR